MMKLVYTLVAASALGGCVQLDDDDTQVIYDVVGNHGRVCGGDEVNCHARVILDVDGNATPAVTPSGYGPTSLRDAYKITGSGSSATTIAIVDAYGYSRAESDLATYRAQFGLPACTTANGCFQKVNQSGVQGNYPPNNTGWSQESALDLDMASAMCPNCKLILVESSSNSLADLAAAVNTAAGMTGVKV